MRNGICYSSVSKGIRTFDKSDHDALINLMKTGIGQSKYCIPQPFSRCLISLCGSLFDFNSTFFTQMFGSRGFFVFVIGCRKSLSDAAIR